MVGRLTPASDPECVFDSRFTCKTALSRSGAEGIRTPALRRAKSDPMVHRGSSEFTKPHNQAFFAMDVRR
jgi:hypothetical protein